MNVLRAGRARGALIGGAVVILVAAGTLVYFLGREGEPAYLGPARPVADRVATCSPG